MTGAGGGGGGAGAVAAGDPPASPINPVAAPPAVAAVPAPPPTAAVPVPVALATGTHVPSTQAPYEFPFAAPFPVPFPFPFWTHLPAVWSQWCFPPPPSQLGPYPHESQYEFFLPFPFPFPQLPCPCLPPLPPADNKLQSRSEVDHAGIIDDGADASKVTKYEDEEGYSATRV